MRHRVASTRLKRRSGELKALLVNQAKQLFMRGSVTTTLVKAKLLRPFAEKLVTVAKENTFTTVKRVKSVLADDAVTRILFDAVAPKFAQRAGGYTRIVKLANRGGDKAPMGRIEFVEAVTAKSSKDVKERSKTNKSVGKKLEDKKAETKEKVSKPATKKVQKDAKN